MSFDGACHCGAVTLRIPRKPDYMNDCNCTLCSKVGGIWGYFSASEVEISGDTRTYVRSDFDNPEDAVIANHFCATCGCNTHWSALPHAGIDRMGVNMRLFGDEAKTGVELRFPDGLNWDEDKPLQMRKEAVIL